MAECIKAIFTLDECEVKFSIKDKFKVTVDDCSNIDSIPFTMEEKIATNPDNGNDPELQKISNRIFKVPEGKFVAGSTHAHIDGGYERDYIEDPSTGEIEFGFDVSNSAIVSLEYKILT